ncbi:MAG: phosphopantothenoylcysteine decarboxylase [Planctomycetota bacterium]
MRILITAGPTREYIDSVRYLSNASTGRMGFALAEEAVRRGHAVELISGPVEMKVPSGVTLARVITAAEMLTEALKRFEGCDAAVMTAAVCDYRPVERTARKLPKNQRSFSLLLEPTEDICARLGAIKGERIVIGFALEDHDEHAKAEAKLHSKNCDAIVLNRPGNIGVEAGEIQIYRPDHGWSLLHSGTKIQLAGNVLDMIQIIFEAKIVKNRTSV